MMSARRWALRIGVGLLIAAGVAVGGLAMSSADRSPAAATVTLARPATSGKPAKPNIVFILTDDLSFNLITKPFMPHIVGLEKQGETFSHYFVADSLCCPSRSTIFTGLFPHDTRWSRTSAQMAAIRSSSPRGCTSARSRSPASGAGTGRRCWAST